MRNLKRHLGLALELAVLLTTALACATPGPARSTISTMLEPPPSVAKPCLYTQTSCKPDATGKTVCETVKSGQCETATLTTGAEPAPEPTATPFAAGFMAGVGYRLGAVEGSHFVPLQLVTGSAALTTVSGRNVSALGIVGVSGTSVSHAQGAWGFGGSVDMTDGHKPYEAALSTGLVWFSEGGPPAAFVGGTFVFKL